MVLTDGKDLLAAVKKDYQLDWQVVKRQPQKRFKVLPWRSLLERTLAWLVGCRRWAIDYQVLPTTSQTLIYAAIVRLLVKRLP